MSVLLSLHLLPIVVLGIVALAVAVERYVALYLSYPMQKSETFFFEIRDLIRARRFDEALDLSAQHASKPVGSVVHQALLRAHQPEALIEQGLAIVVSQLSQRVQKRTNYLALMANVSTLLGLFGTILGLIQSFEALGGASAQQRSALLTQGISTAMNATLIGLGVAIPSMIAFTILANRGNKHVAEIEEAALRSMDILKEHYYSVEKPSQKKAG